MVTQDAERANSHKHERFNNSIFDKAERRRRVNDERSNFAARMRRDSQDALFRGRSRVAIVRRHIITEGMLSRRLGFLSEQIGIAIGPDDLEYRSKKR